MCLFSVLYSFIGFKYDLCRIVNYDLIKDFFPI